MNKTATKCPLTVKFLAEMAKERESLAKRREGLLASMAHDISQGRFPRDLDISDAKLTDGEIESLDRARSQTEGMLDLADVDDARIAMMLMSGFIDRSSDQGLLRREQQDLLGRLIRRHLIETQY